MKTVLAVLLLTALCLLSACGGQRQASTTTTEEKPLLTDADFDKVVKRPATHVTELFGSQESAAALQELPPLADVPLAETQGELSAQAVLSYWDSRFVYAVYNPPVPVNGSPTSPLYSIYYRETFDRITTTNLLYQGYREVQSVQQGRYEAIVSMRETTDPNSDFEVFLIDPQDLSIEQVTFDDVDNTNAAIKRYGGWNFLIAYQQPMNGKETIVTNQFVLSHPDPQRHPSISDDNVNSGYIALVRDPINGNDSIQRYDRANQSYLTVAQSPSPTIRMDSASINYDGQKVAWLETDSSGFQEIKLADLNAGTVQVVASGTLLARPHLDYPLMTYQVDRNIFVKDLETGEVEVVLASNPLESFTKFYSVTGVFFTPPISLQVHISGLPSVQKRVRVTGPYGFDSGLFGSSRTLEHLNLGTYTISAQGFRVNVGRPTCRIYTPDFFSQTATVRGYSTNKVDVVYRSEPCGF